MFGCELFGGIRLAGPVVKKGEGVPAWAAREEPGGRARSFLLALLCRACQASRAACAWVW